MYIAITIKHPHGGPSFELEELQLVDVVCLFTVALFDAEE